jgi:hypothetical protein
MTGARVGLVDAHGRTVAEGTSGKDGEVLLRARPGDYMLVASPVARARITPSPRAVILSKARPRRSRVVLTYYTGIQ